MFHICEAFYSSALIPWFGGVFYITGYAVFGLLVVTSFGVIGFIFWNFLRCCGLPCRLVIFTCGVNSRSGLSGFLLWFVWLRCLVWLHWGFFDVLLVLLCGVLSRWAFGDDVCCDALLVFLVLLRFYLGLMSFSSWVCSYCVRL